MSARWITRLLSACLLTGLCGMPASAVDFLQDDANEAPAPQRTLFQWSEGNSFGGGPAGRNERLIADRPDFVEASVPVGLGVLQVELGYTYSYDNDGSGSVRSHSYPETLFRYGIWQEWFELRLAFNVAEEETVGGAGSSISRGSEDIYLGAKIGLTPQEGALPETALLVNLVVPSGSLSLTAGEVLPGVTYIYAWELDNGWGLAGQTQGNRALDEGTGNPYLEFSQAIVAGTSLTDRIGYYAEWYCLIPDGADTAPVEHYFDTGFTYGVSNDLQLDVRFGIGLNDDSDDYFVGTGIVKRF